jgi:hypothetical protein
MSKDLDLSHWTKEDWTDFDSRMRAITRMFKIKDIFG